MSKISFFYIFVLFVSISMLGVHSWENMDYDNFQSPISELGSGPRSSSPLLHVGGNEIMKNKKSDLMVLCGTHLFRAIRVACAGSFQKRSQGHFEFNGNNEYPNSPIFERLRDVALLRNMYKRGGASDVCCNQPCSKRDLLTFC
ncbi:uncharacterized protein [Lepeophtheirus salmonis]|uniref:uncharacterized protein n=1 Tax=Lepeophtheirus salmonis TaxID=72036 RepID=UPI001AE53F66|nr:uncharacterized protein LOC121114514 [Lepeophtheirus salmonis]XP_040564440.1 uncharacterized protein LOC121114514 [Lepeophtheirus salmonis]